MQVGFVCTYSNAIYVDGPEHISQIVEPVPGSFTVPAAEIPAGGINEDNFAGLCVLEFNQSDGRHRELRTVPNRHGNNVVALIKQT